MKKTPLYLLISIVLIGLFCMTTPVSADTTTDGGQYTVLVQLPGVGDTTGGTTKLSDYLPAVFNLAIGIAAALAFVMIVLGGITYATTDALSGKADGRERITNAIWGLLLVIGAWVILNTINPQILKFNLTLPRPNVSTSTSTALTTALPGTPPGYTGSGYTSSTVYSGQAANGGILPGYSLQPNEITQNTTMVSDLLGHNVTVNNGGAPCSTGLTSGCTNIVGEPVIAISDVEKIASTQGCNCTVMITGGTEGGHAEHGPGKAVMDLALNPTLNNYITSNGGTPVNTSLGPQYTMNKGGVSATFLQEGDHWHVTFH